MASETEAAVSRQYSRGDVGSAILKALKDEGKDVDKLSEEDLAPADHLHTGGRQATLAMAELVGVQRDWQVLDVGGGMGGPARTLASSWGCHVTVLDLSEGFVRIGEDLTSRTGLGDLVSFRQGSALEMPFDDGSFDLVWTQHSSMNIEDKAGLYRECRRVVKDGGRLAIHEVTAGSSEPAYYPAPWADDPSISFLRPAEEVRKLIGSSGFKELAWDDLTPMAVAFVRERAANPPAAGELGLNLQSPDFLQKVANAGKSLAEGRLATVRGIFEAV